MKNIRPYVKVVMASIASFVALLAYVFDLFSIIEKVKDLYRDFRPIWINIVASIDIFIPLAYFVLVLFLGAAWCAILIRRANSTNAEKSRLQARNNEDYLNLIASEVTEVSDRIKEIYFKLGKEKAHKLRGLVESEKIDEIESLKKIFDDYSMHVMCDSSKIVANSLKLLSERYFVLRGINEAVRVVVVLLRPSDGKHGDLVEFKLDNIGKINVVVSFFDDQTNLNLRKRMRDTGRALPQYKMTDCTALEKLAQGDKDVYCCNRIDELDKNLYKAPPVCEREFGIKAKMVIPIEYKPKYDPDDKSTHPNVHNAFGFLSIMSQNDSNSVLFTEEKGTLYHITKTYVSLLSVIYYGVSQADSDFGRVSRERMGTIKRNRRVTDRVN